MKPVRIIILFTIFLCLASCTNVFGLSKSDSSRNRNKNSYTVEPIFGISQKKNTSNFFDMTLKPKQEDTFKLTITNESLEPQQFKINVNTAMTNNNGIVDYTKESFMRDDSMILMLNNLITPNTEVVNVAGSESQSIDFHITMPEKPFEGILLGGITVRPIESTSGKSGINNVYMHTIAIRVNETDKDIQAKLEGGSVRIGQINRQNIISMSIRNPQPKLLSNLKGEFSIKEKGSNKELVQEKKEDLSVAPNTKFEFPIFLKNHFKMGNYTYTINLMNKDGKWTFSKDFTIKKKQADEYNARSIDKASHNNVWKRYIMIIFLIAILCISFYKFGKRRGKM